MKRLKDTLLDTKINVITVAIIIASLLAVPLLMQSTPVIAKASPSEGLNKYAIDCNQISDVYGKAETTLNVSTEGRYRLWAKMKSSNPGSDSFYVKVDDVCFIMGNNTNIENWTWIDYVSGSQDSKFDLDVTAGTLDLEFYAREKGVQLDKIQLIGDTARCENAYRTGSNCVATDIPESNIVEDVNIIGLVEGAMIHTATIIQAEPHPTLDVNSIKFYIDGVGVRTDGSVPYCMQGARAENCKAYDFTTLSEGSHTLTVEVSTNNAGTFTKDLTFTYSNVMHSGTANDDEVPTFPEEVPETDYPNEGETVVVDEEVVSNLDSTPTNQDAPITNDNPEELGTEQPTNQDTSTPSDEIIEQTREIIPSLINTTSEFLNNQALITDTSRPTIRLNNVVSTDLILLNGRRIPTSNTITLTETGRNVISVSDSSATILSEYVIAIRYPDFDGDNKIGSSDLRKIILNWRTANDRYDLNGDGIINSLDIRILINKWSELQ